MSRSIFLLSMAVAVGSTLALSGGCGSSQTGGRRPETAAETASARPNPSDSQDERADDVSDADIEKALAALSTKDRAVAEKQRVCPVTEERLGSMGTPVKVQVEGRDVFLCCAGCEGELRAKASEYLAKLPK